MMTNELLALIKKDFRYLPDQTGHCSVCGNVLEVEQREVICSELAADWELTKKQVEFFNYREGNACIHCHSSARIRNYANTIMETLNGHYGREYRFFKDLAAADQRDFWQSLQVAEINNCLTLHEHLMKLPRLYYSEYGSKDPAVPTEDLMRLTYTDSFFDLVLMSDVLEHVPDLTRGIAEVYRVLKKKGFFIFTVPILEDRRSRSRARLGQNHQIEHLLPKSYHGQYKDEKDDFLVFHELGYDFVEALRGAGFDASLYAHEGFGGTTNAVFVCER
jgi:SAM-dependent methyltransferase